MYLKPDTYRAHDHNVHISLNVINLALNLEISKALGPPPQPLRTASHIARRASDHLQDLPRPHFHTSTQNLAQITRYNRPEAAIKNEALSRHTGAYSGGTGRANYLPLSTVPLVRPSEGSRTPQRVRVERPA